jgi:hypothetical protein
MPSVDCAVCAGSEYADDTKRTSMVCNQCADPSEVLEEKGTSGPVIEG